MAAKNNSEVTLKLKDMVAPGDKKNRPGDNSSKLHYVKAEYCATKLDEIFGPEKWSVEILNQHVEAREQTLMEFKRNSNQRGEYLGRVAWAWVTVRLTVTFPDGTKAFRDGIGSGDAIRRVDNPNSVEAEGLAIKAAATDALKRAATLLGNIFGRGLEKDGTQRYDYDYSPPEEDEADEETRPTTAIDIEGQPKALPEPLRQIAPPPADSRRETVQQTREISRETQRQPGAHQPQSQARDPFENDHPQNLRPQEGQPDGGQDRSALMDTVNSPLARELYEIIPQGTLLDLGSTQAWRAVFVKMNDLRTTRIRNLDDLRILKEWMKDFRERTKKEGILDGGSAGAAAIKNYFDSMDQLIERTRQQLSATTIEHV